MKKFLLLPIATLILSCSSDDYFNISNEDSMLQYQDSVATVSDEGYLVFPSSQSLQSFVEDISNGKTPTIINNSTRANSTKGFESLADLSKKIEETKTRSIDISNYDESVDDLSDLEEMSEDEFNLMKAENLIFDNIMSHMVDTTLRICVENRLYKITEYGTFSVDIKDAEKIETTIEEFDKELVYEVPVGESTKLNEDVTFTNSFSQANVQANVNLFPSGPVADNNATQSETTVRNTFHSGYNTQSYKWENNSLLQKFLDSLKGKDVSRENKFNKNRRVQVSVFDVNYAFYASAGVKVKMQKRKKFLGIPYWKQTEAEKLVLGFNMVEGIMKYSDPRHYSSITPSPSSKWGSFTGTLNGIQSNFIFGIYNDLDFIEDWTDQIICLMPEIPLGDTNWWSRVGNKLYDLPASYISQQLKSLEGKYIYGPIQKRITPEDPMMAYLVYGKSCEVFEKERPFITGVKEYTNRESKSVIFDRSFGFSFYNGCVSGFLPSEFDIKKIDVFGAAFYEGEWRGVRFYKE